MIYGEAMEYIRGHSDYEQRRGQLRTLLRQVTPHRLTYSVPERYAELRRSMRPPHGAGLIGDIDTLIAATAIEHGLTMVTAAISAPPTPARVPTWNQKVMPPMA